MHRLLVALLAAFDAVIAAAAGLAVVLAPLTLLWVMGFEGSADWSALWPSSARIWQLGNLVPLQLTLDDTLLADVGIPQDAASFTFSLAPLAFAAFVLIFAYRSGRRAALAGAWITGAVGGTTATALLATVVAFTSATPAAQVQVWQAILLPAAVYAVGIFSGAVATAWRAGDHGVIDTVRAVAGDLPGGWGEVPALAVRGTAIVMVSLLGVAGVALAFAVVWGGGEMIALFEASQVDVLGAVVVTLGQLAYLPTLLVWALCWIAGPGIAFGTGTAVSPAGTQLGVVPGVPALGLLPESGSPWLLLVLLVPVAAGAAAGWAVRSRFVELASPRGAHEPVAPRLVLVLALAILSGGAGALLAAVASGSVGPGRLVHVGAAPGPIALAVGLEVAVGAAILLLSPRSLRRRDASGVHDAAGAPHEASSRLDERDPDADTAALGELFAASPLIGRSRTPDARSADDDERTPTRLD